MPEFFGLQKYIFFHTLNTSMRIYFIFSLLYLKFLTFRYFIWIIQMV